MVPFQNLDNLTLNENSVEHGDGSMGEQLMQSPAAVSTSGQDGIPEESNSDSVLAGVHNSVVNHEGSRTVNQRKEMDYSDHAIEGRCKEQIQCSSSEENQAMPTSEDNLTLHSDGSPDLNVRSNYYVSPESIGDAISAENCKKVAAEVLAEKSILASEVQGRQSRLFDISQERNHFMSVIDEMHQTLQRRLDLAEAERAAAEMEMIEREKMTQEMLKEQEALLDAAKEESKKLVQQAEENAKLQELLMDRGHVVDALHGRSQLYCP